MTEQAIDDLQCPFCGGAIIRFTSGYSEYDHACSQCEAGFAIDLSVGRVRSRVWDRKAAHGLHEEFALARMRKPAS